MKSGYISIIGPPNSGKSTLLNCILGEELSIVTPKPQTTRRKIIGIHNIPGAQMIFLDTPGIHESSKPLNRYMMEEVNSALKDADVVCIVEDVREILDAKHEVRSNKHDFISSASHLLLYASKLLSSGKKYLTVLNKLDLIFDQPWDGIVSDCRKVLNRCEVVGISAKTGFGVDMLVQRIAEMLPEGEPFYPDDIYTEHPLRFLVSEIIREQVLNLMRQEIPYSVAVDVEAYKEEASIHRIEAAIIVEKESQKPMIIGKGGAMIKRIGELARAKIESMVGCKVFLKLFVKVEKNWTRDKKAVRALFRHTY